MKTFFHLVCCAFLASPLAAAPEPSLTLQVFLRSECQLEEGDPVLVSLRASNPAASDVHAKNQHAARLFRGYRDSGALDSLEPADVDRLRAKYALRPLALFQIGTAEKLAQRCVSFSVLDSSNRSLALAARPARGGNPWATQTTLDGVQNLEGDWIVEFPRAPFPHQSTFQLQASLEFIHSSSRAVGTITSRPARILPAEAGRSGRLQRELDQGILHLRDADWVQGAQRAEAAIALDARSVAAWTLRGDVERGRQQWAQAELFYRKALELSQGGWLDHTRRRFFPRPEDEPPEYLLQRLAEALSKQGRLR